MLRGRIRDAGSGAERAERRTESQGSGVLRPDGWGRPGPSCPQLGFNCSLSNAQASRVRAPAPKAMTLRGKDTLRLNLGGALDTGHSGDRGDHEDLWHRKPDSCVTNILPSEPDFVLRDQEVEMGWRGDSSYGETEVQGC